MDDSDDSRLDEGVDDGGKTEPSIFDRPVAFGAASAAEYAPAEDALGGSTAGAEGRDGELLRQRDPQEGLHLPAAAAMVISEYLGGPFDLQYDARLNTGAEAFELTGGRLAGEPGLWEGMSLEDGAAALEHYGIDAHVEHGNVSSLDRYLEEGRSIILSVDADELAGQDDDSSPAERTADHALVLSAIDEDAGVAILQDPANPRGDGFEVSLADLEDAWADSANGMVVTDTAGRDFGDERAAMPSDEAAKHDDEQAERIRTLGPAGAVILPIVFGGRALIRRRPRG
jgi:hypothetical protein